MVRWRGTGLYARLPLAGRSRTEARGIVLGGGEMDDLFRLEKVFAVLARRSREYASLIARMGMLCRLEMASRVSVEVVQGVVEILADPGFAARMARSRWTSWCQQSRRRELSRCSMLCLSKRKP